MCGVIGQSGKLNGASTHIGVYKCYACRKPFTAKVGTVFESSHLPQRHWLQAIYLIASGNKGTSTNQLQRTLGITIKAAWFLSHRIREATRDCGMDLFGVTGSPVEVDETFIGNKEPRQKGQKRKLGRTHKMKALSLVDRATGKARSIDLKVTTLIPILRANIALNAKADGNKEKAKVGRTETKARLAAVERPGAIGAFHRNNEAVGGRRDR
ncbi:IS1595 family transposase [Caenimonas koreensis DSM 17982]|uniref:IS1595 family transposase n=2 Tax=Caenimonas TaxID=763439 RepID=A0A844B599_9BURK|nr:IS1595 family transposase [Caenimonas koreensis DSM 17982]